MVEIRDICGDYAEYLRDESRDLGEVQSISFPKTEEDVRFVLRQMNDTGCPVTVQGARTGLAAADRASKELLALTADQYEVLESLSENPRTLVSGVAGAGKTLIAMEQTRRATDRWRSSMPSILHCRKITFRNQNGR